MGRDVFTPITSLSRTFHYLAYAGIFSAVVSSIWILTGRQANHTFAVVTLISFGIIGVPVAFLLCRVLLFNLSENFPVFVRPHCRGAKESPQQWFTCNLAFFEGATGMYIAGFTTSIFSLISWYLQDVSEQEEQVTKFISLSAMTVSGFVGGMGLWSIWKSTTVFHKFGKEYDFVLEAHHMGVLSVGRTLLKCYFIILSAFVPYVAGSILVYQNSTREHQIDLLSIPMMALGYPVIILIFWGFVQSQYTIHRKMLASKRYRLVEIDAILRALEPSSALDLDEDRARKIAFFKSEKAAILTLPEWPSSFRVFGGAAIVSIYGLAMPTVVSLVVEEGWAFVADLARA